MEFSRCSSVRGLQRAFIMADPKQPSSRALCSHDLENLELGESGAPQSARGLTSPDSSHLKGLASKLPC
nr:hypothetical protein CFP56_64964 [Quercus suber]